MSAVWELTDQASIGARAQGTSTSLRPPRSLRCQAACTSARGTGLDVDAEPTLGGHSHNRGNVSKMAAGGCCRRRCP